MLALGATLAAHDFWIEPSSFEPAPGAPVRVHLRVGELFAGDPVARDSRAIVKFFAVGPGGEQAIPGRDGVDPAGVMRFDTPGLWILGYRGTPSEVTLDAAAFEKYLKEEGLERIIAERAQRGEASAPGREIFSRSVKALLRVGGADAQGFDRPLGLTLEIVPEENPYLRGTTRLPVRLLYDGAPLEGALIVAIRKEPGAAGPGQVASTARSDRTGRAALTVEPGLWLLKAVHMVRARADVGADWESIWTSLTFNLPSERQANQP